MMISEVFPNLNDSVILTHWEALGIPVAAHPACLLACSCGAQVFLELCGCAHSELRYSPESNKNL